MTTANDASDASKKAPELRDRYVVPVVAVLYVVTRYPDVGGRINMGDSAKFQFLARELGIGHSPGNPLYLMLSALWVRLPLPLSDATKVTLLSSIFGVVTLLLVTRTVRVLDLRPVLTRPFVLSASSFTAILLGLGSLFWTLSTEAEVYTLGCVFVAGVILGVAQWTVRRDRRGLLLAIASLVLGLSNHLTIAALGPGLLYVLLRDADARAELKKPAPWLVGAGSALLVLTAYGWIAWRVSKPLSYSEFPRPFNLASFVDFVTARKVRSTTLQKTSYASAVFDRLPDLYAGVQKQWGWPMLLFFPLGAIRLVRLHGTFALLLLLGVLGHLVLAFLFRIPDPEGLFVSVAVLLAIPLALVPEALAELPSTVFTQERVAIGMLLIHGAFVAAHVSRWLTHPFTAYVQRTRDGEVILNLPTLADALPENAMVGVPCGHYGCIEITTYYKLVDRGLRDKGISFVRFSWSEWNERLSAVPLVDPKAPRTRPICVLLPYDVVKLSELDLLPKPIPRAPVRVLGRKFDSGPVHCVLP